MPVCGGPLVAHPSLAWCLERKIPVGRRPFSQAGRKRSGFLGYHEQSPPPYPPQGPNRPRPRTHLHQMHRSGNVTPIKEKRAKVKTKEKKKRFQHGSEPCEPEQELVLVGGTGGGGCWTWMLLTLHVPMQSKPDVHRGRLLIPHASGDDWSWAHLQTHVCFKAGVMAPFSHYSARCAMCAASISLFLSCFSNACLRPYFPSALQKLARIRKGSKLCKEVERAAAVKTENHKQPWG